MGVDLWELARARAGAHVFSTLFPAQSVDRDLGTEQGIKRAIEWCRETGVTKVYLESFRGAHFAKEANLSRARDRFREAGLEASGCVTTTELEVPPGQKQQFFPCLTYGPAQEQVGRIFERTARLFDEIMIDDFWCTTCECSECRAARGARSWSEYRLELLMRLSEERVLGPARAANPGVKVIIKYPQWYEQFHERGYDVERQSRLFDRTWVGTETRDVDDERWGGCAGYRAYWLMRWLGQIGGEKCGGGWYDPYGTHEETYLEQARQTVLGGARESVLFCYPSLQEHTGPANVEAFRMEVPRLLDLAAWVKGEEPRGIVSYRPPNAPAQGEEHIFDWLGMIGLPVVAGHEFPSGATTALLTAHGLHDGQLGERARELAAHGASLLCTEQVVKATRVGGSGVASFMPPSPTRGLVDLPEEEIAALRRHALEPLGMSLEGPTWVALYLFGERKVVLENFGDRPAEMRLGLPGTRSYRVAMALGAEGGKLKKPGGAIELTVGPRSLVALEGGAG